MTENQESQNKSQSKAMHLKTTTFITGNLKNTEDMENCKGQ